MLEFKCCFEKMLPLVSVVILILLLDNPMDTMAFRKVPRNYSALVDGISKLKISNSSGYAEPLQRMKRSRSVAGIGVSKVSQQSNTPGSYRNRKIPMRPYSNDINSRRMMDPNGMSDPQSFRFLPGRGMHHLLRKIFATYDKEVMPARPVIIHLDVLLLKVKSTVS